MSPGLTRRIDRGFRPASLATGRCQNLRRFLGEGRKLDHAIDMRMASASAIDHPKHLAG